MKVEIRIPGSLYSDAIADLTRAHPFAAERIGFFSVALGRLSAEHLLLLVNGFSPIPDEEYIDDPWAGARIGTKAIRGALQRILDMGSGQLHVHLHDHEGYPGPSRMDARETPPLVKSMVATGPACAHGAIILSRNRAWAQISAPGAKEPIIVSGITVAGFPFHFLK